MFDIDTQSPTQSHGLSLLREHCYGSTPASRGQGVHFVCERHFFC